MHERRTHMHRPSERLQSAISEKCTMRIAYHAHSRSGELACRQYSIRNSTTLNTTNWTSDGLAYMVTTHAGAAPSGIYILNDHG